MTALTPTNTPDARKFISSPMGPVVLTVTISIRQTISDMISPAIGPKIKAPMVRITSFGS